MATATRDVIQVTSERRRQRQRCSRARLPPPRPARRRISRRDAARRALKRLSVSRPEAGRRDACGSATTPDGAYINRTCAGRIVQYLVVASGERRRRAHEDGATVSPHPHPACPAGARDPRTATLPMGAIADPTAPTPGPLACPCSHLPQRQGRARRARRGRAESSRVRRHVSRDLRSRPGRAKSRAGAASRPARDA